jgi:hypothetical protein
VEAGLAEKLEFVSRARWPKFQSDFQSDAQ